MSKLQSMTGFARAERTEGALTAICEMRSVNGKNLDIRLRIPSGLEAIESGIKKQISGKIARGNLQVSVNVESDNQAFSLKIDETAFGTMASAAKSLAEKHGLAAPTVDGLLALRGVIQSDDSQRSLGDEGVKELVQQVVLDATAALIEMRETEGASLHAILNEQLKTIDGLVHDAHADEANAPEAIMTRLQAQLDTLLAGQDGGVLDAGRLNAEAALLATKADIREEIDRLKAHVQAAHALLKGGGAIGRKLDFLSQEFNRETNTVCSKSASATLTATGLALKAVIDQFREQVQNLQ